MIRSERIAKRINKNIKTWTQNHEKLIIAIDGYAGSGKTTIADCIERENPEVLVLHLDDFINHWKKRKNLIDHAKNKSKVFEYDWYRYDDLEKIIKQFKSNRSGTAKFKIYDYDANDFGPEKSLNLSKKVLVVEGIFLFHSERKLNNLWDKKVYLEVNFDKADRMRISREKKKWGKAYLSEEHPDNWTKYFKIAYRRYIKKCKPREHADITFRI